MELTRNQGTQPIPQMAIFNNWDTVAEGWYFVCPSKELRSLHVKAFRICNQELVFYRGADGCVRALDAYCPHMGTHLGVGRVRGNNIQCFFHHWQFNPEGRCVSIPCHSEIPSNARVQSYAVTEQFDAIWVYPATKAAAPLAHFDELDRGALTIQFGKAYTRTCHHHVTMINGIDPQHLQTVHNLDVTMNVSIQENDSSRVLDICLEGDLGTRTLGARITQKLIGAKYAYAMRYDHGSIGLLTLVRNVRLFGTGPKLPTLHMIFAYRPLSKGKTLVQPIFITQKRAGIAGWFWSRLLLFFTRRGFYALQGEDGKVYENMRFFPQNLLPIDRPIAQFIQFVNRLKPSNWRLG